MSNSATKKENAKAKIDNGTTTQTNSKAFKSLNDFNDIKEYADYLNSVLGWKHLDSDRWVVKTNQILKILELENFRSFEDYHSALDYALDCYVYSIIEVPYSDENKATNQYIGLKAIKDLLNSLAHSSIEDRPYIINNYLIVFLEESTSEGIKVAVDCFVVHSFESEITGEDLALDYIHLNKIKEAFTEVVKIQSSN